MLREVLAMSRITTAEEQSRTILTTDGQLSGESVAAVETWCNQASSGVGPTVFAGCHIGRSCGPKPLEPAGCQGVASGSQQRVPLLPRPRVDLRRERLPENSTLGNNGTGRKARSIA
jgi:hypothetical protein